MAIIGGQQIFVLSFLAGRLAGWQACEELAGREPGMSPRARVTSGMSMARASENDGGALGLLEEEEQGQEEEHQGGGQGQEVGQEL